MYNRTKILKVRPNTVIHNLTKRSKKDLLIQTPILDKTFVTTKKQAVLSAADDGIQSPLIGNRRHINDDDFDEMGELPPLTGDSGNSQNENEEEEEDNGKKHGRSQPQAQGGAAV